MSISKSNIPSNIFSKLPPLSIIIVSIFPIIFSGALLGYTFALIVGMDGAFAVAMLVSAMYAYIMRKPVAVVMILLLCFPVTYIIPIAVSAIIASKIPTPFGR